MAATKIDTSKPDRQILDELVQRTVRIVQPLQIILFGSAGQGTMGPDSDLDLLIVVPDGAHRRKTAQKIYKNLRGLGFSKDIIVVTESDMHRYKDNPSLIIYPAITQGQEIYHAAD